MPIQIEFSEDQQGVVYNAHGEVNGKDILDAKLELYNDSRFDKLKYFIIDRTWCTSYNVESSEVQKSTDMAHNASQRNGDLIVAMVSKSDLQFGMARMFELMLNDTAWRIGNFRDRKLADEWVSLHLNPDNPSTL